MAAPPDILLPASALTSQQALKILLIRVELLLSVLPAEKPSLLVEIST